MFENATILHIRPGLLKEAIQTLRKTIFPIVRRQKGLLSLALIPRPEQNLVIVLSIWESPIRARTVEADPAFRQAIRRLDDLVLESDPGQGGPYQVQPDMEQPRMWPN